MRELDIARIDSIGGVKDISADWENLRRMSGNESLFLTHPWLIEWWQIYGGQNALYILLAKEGDSLVGAAPLMVKSNSRGVRSLMFVGMGEVTPNHINFLALKDGQSDVFDAFAAYIFEIRSQWDLLELKGISDEHSLRLMRASLKKYQIHTHAEVHANCPFVELTESFEGYLQSRGKSTRQGYRRYLRKLIRDFPNIEFGVVETELELVSAFQALVELHQSRWVARGEPGVFFSTNFEQFLFAMAKRALEQNFLRMYFLKFQNKFIAVECNFQVGDTVYYYLSGFDRDWGKYGVGVQLLGYALKRSISEGASEFDFLQGDEAYKAQWATNNRVNWRLRASSLHVRGRIAWIRYYMKHEVKRLIKGFLNIG